MIFLPNHRVFIIGQYLGIAPSLSRWARHEHSESCLYLPPLMNHKGAHASEASCVTVLFSLAVASVLVEDFVCSHLDCAGSLLRLYACCQSLSSTVWFYTLIIKASAYWSLTTHTVTNLLSKQPTWILVALVLFTTRQYPMCHCGWGNRLLEAHLLQGSVTKAGL